jgi:hypothetical protein
MLADVLDALEPILLEIAHAPGSADDLAELRRRIEEQELLFKVRALRAQVRGREQAARKGPVS